MKKLNHLTYFIDLTVMVIFALTSCENGDVTKPVINIIEPDEGAKILIGSPNGMHFEADFSDNEKLKSYKLNIHNNFDHHGHEGLTTADDEGTPFYFEQDYDISELRNTHVHHHDIKIPADAAAGDYHLMIWCTDEAGNQSCVVRNIVLSHDAEEDND